ncbi:hypothetical protein D4764_21G0007140 [Takifugu flavidus]|uniref:Uncharacterized protein n=1 Tax=Takifugu flavidus TaxID=433684 RepID=A0A5C6NE75_9TELE|nr:hypothetical protein D4764_21G0007140 [Takifugu flavidus]
MSNNNLLEEMVSWQLKATLNITQDLRIAGDNRSIPGMDRVDELAEYLVELREQTGLTLNNQQVSTILGLWQSLDKFDKDRIVYAARHQDRLLTGRFRSPKKKAVFTPGVEKTIFARLCNIHTSPKERGQHSVSRWSLILQDYKKIRQLVLCNGTLMQQTTFQRVVNQTTLMQWYNQRLKGAARRNPLTLQVPLRNLEMDPTLRRFPCDSTVHHMDPTRSIISAHWGILTPASASFVIFELDTSNQQQTPVVVQSC